MPTDTDLISKVRGVLMDAARAGKTITFSEVEKKVGEQIGAWRKVLDPIYEDCVARGRPDLTAIVIYNATGYPPFLNDGGDARSKRFDPNNMRQVEQWQKEVSRVFEWCNRGLCRETSQPRSAEVRGGGICRVREKPTPGPTTAFS